MPKGCFMKTINMLAEELSIGYWKIKYAHNSGKIIEPEVIGGIRIYSEKMCKVVKDYFDSKSDTKKNSSVKPSRKQI